MLNKDIQILRVNYLRGPGMWTYRPVIEAVVDIGALEDFPSNTLPGFYDRLTAWLPGLVEHRCGIGERGGFLQRLREGTWPAHILEHVMIELQGLAGVPSGFGKARETGKRGVYKVVVRSHDEAVGRRALQAARDLVMAAIEDRAYDVEAAVAQLREVADAHCLGPSTGCIVDAALDRRIPFMRLSEGNLVQLGYGCAQHRIWTAETDRTSAIGENISRDKGLTKLLLQSCGIPVPEGDVVDSPEGAWEAAESIGLPVVVKPSDANHGRGVSTHLMTRDEVMAAYEVAAAEGSDVIVERFVPGREHRLLVVGGKVVAAARGEAVSVRGDGKSTVRELIELQVNSDPRRGREENFPLDLILLDEEPAVRLQLARQGYDADSVPPAGQDVLVQRHGNMAFDVTDTVHPDIAELGVLAAKVVGLDIAGVDLVVEDIARPLEAQGGAIVEVNAGPGLLMHLKPANGQPRPVGQAIVDHLFPSGDSGRIPVVGITGSRGKTMVARLVATLLNLSGRHTGLACSDGLFLGARHVEKRDAATWEAGHKVLMNRKTQAAVLENGVRTILEAGLAYDRCAVGVVTNLLAAEGLDDHYVHTLDQVYNVMRTQVDVVLADGYAVLNAADPRVVPMAELCDGGVIFFALSHEHQVIVEHRTAGGRAVFLRDGQLVLANGANETELLGLASIPLAQDGVAVETIENILAAVAVAWALDISPELIRAGAEAFSKEQAIH